MVSSRLPPLAAAALPAESAWSEVSEPAVADVVALLLFEGV
jgi:hypothetical protein